MSEEPRDADQLFDDFLELLNEEGDPARGAPEGSDVEAAPTSFFFGVRAPAPVTPGIAGFIMGDTIGDFRLLRELGRGGMGQVWEAEELSLRRRVALKLVLPERIGDRTLELFGREARAGGRLSHPAIVSVHGHGESDGVHWISQELVPGGWTMRDFIDEMRALDELPPNYDARVALFVAELADALQAAHDAGVIHRDLKPQNILITEDDRPKLTDFGLARITDETALSRTGEFAGTYYYMSPEQVSARRMGLDHRTDVFSLGVVLYEALGLHRPFEGDTTHQIAEKILLHDPPPLTALRSRVPTDLSVIAGKAMEKRPDKRYGSMAELAADLRRFLAHEPIHARPATRADRLAKWAQRHPTLSAAGAVTLVAAVALGALGFAYVGKAVQAAEDGARVKRLSARTAYDELVERADRLWPPHPELQEELAAWDSDARALVARLERDGDAPGLRRLLAEDESRAVDEREVEDTQLAARVVQARERLASLRRAQEVRDGQRDFEPFQLGPHASEDPEELLKRSRALAGNRRQRFGREDEGLACARRALALALDDATALRALDAIAWAAFACGLDDEAAPMRAEAEALAAAVPELSATLAPATLYTAMDEAPAELAAAEVEVGLLEAAAARRKVLTFPSEEQDWSYAVLRSIVDDLEGLVDPTSGLLAETGISPEHGWSIPRRAALAERLARGFQEGGPFAGSWAEHAEAIARTCPGFELAPQTGLVPIGRDPHSGRYEFWHVASGTEPHRGVDDELVLEESSGIVFVLLAGGPTLIGAQIDDPGGANYRPLEGGEREDPNDLPPHEVELSPFFLSKYELTQAQWLRLTGANPSYLNPGAWIAPVTPRHPVEQVTWYDATEVLARYGLQLPSEAEWEYACRAGSNTTWPFGPTARRIGEHANVEVDDGFRDHAPVGSFAPDAFGLHDMLGNVAEWCRDGYDRYYHAVIEREDPVAPTVAADYRTTRGGAYATPPVYAHPALRESRRPFEAHRYVGLRPARAVTTSP